MGIIRIFTVKKEMSASMQDISFCEKVVIVHNFFYQKCFLQGLANVHSFFSFLLNKIINS